MWERTIIRGENIINDDSCLLSSGIYVQAVD